MECLLPANDAVLNVIIHRPLLLPVDVPLRREVRDVAREPSGEVGDIEAVDEVNAALARKKTAVEDVDVVAEDGDDAHAGDHHSFLGVALTRTKVGAYGEVGPVAVAAMLAARGGEAGGVAAAEWAHCGWEERKMGSLHG